MSREKVHFIDSEQQYDIFCTKERYVLYFSTEECSVCHAVFPRLEKMLDEYPLDIGRVDANSNKKLAGQNLVFNIPTILVFDEGKEVLRESRFIDFDRIQRLLDLMF
ncbi:MAG: thioredoxin family protein [Gudongella sp.]|jgi:thiol-disulfide isomerase/thioredoxin|nr:thioredoxin family protein [Gudongella sp.]